MRYFTVNWLPLIYNTWYVRPPLRGSQGAPHVWVYYGLAPNIIKPSISMPYVIHLRQLVLILTLTVNVAFGNLKCWSLDIDAWHEHVGCSEKQKKIMATNLILKFNVILLKLCDFLLTIPGEWRLTCTDDIVPLRGDYRCKELTASQLLIVRKQF